MSLPNKTINKGLMIGQRKSFTVYSPFFNYSPMYQLKSRTTVILLSLFNIM
jgi:hypothetical protein